ncbi:unnamed protein product [Protopolystoma xenopodis]|uniref:Uncharacterized protein n=1 Tax=Protopolystoma xenopodis TaxID=117903 RepID=A0A3S5A1P1_9PLAT|nr:unnamed protein product [Protopolystoma xenopodis]
MDQHKGLEYLLKDLRLSELQAIFPTATVRSLADVYAELLSGPPLLGSTKKAAARLSREFRPPLKKKCHSKSVLADRPSCDHVPAVRISHLQRLTNFVLTTRVQISLHIPLFNYPVKPNSTSSGCYCTQKRLFFDVPPIVRLWRDYKC